MHALLRPHAQAESRIMISGGIISTTAGRGGAFCTSQANVVSSPHDIITSRRHSNELVPISPSPATCMICGHVTTRRVSGGMRGSSPPFNAVIEPAIDVRISPSALSKNNGALQRFICRGHRHRHGHRAEAQASLTATASVLGLP